ncbi:molybdopterin-guanine dinucleotide biosynthesis protein MobC, partial [Klebsiella pneumoniae]|nr:molybdopterin-guanine dinucleotide biosynthesis protein MobC [Klebsiella pneumoniae]
MLIHNVSERKKASADKMLSLLNFLKEETYSDFNTLR